MKLYLISLGAGVLVGLIYSLLGVRSPAPPLVALVGLLGILAGEQVIPVGKLMLAGTSLTTAWTQANCAGHIFSPLAGHHSNEAAVVSAESKSKRS